MDETIRAVIENLRQYITEVEGHVLDVLDAMDDRIAKLEADVAWASQKVRQVPAYRQAGLPMDNSLRWNRFGLE